MSDGERARPARTWRDRQIVQLTLVRFREFLREPEAVFWVFVFPILLAAGLGIAFRNRSADTVTVAVVERPDPGHIEFAKVLAKAKGINVQALTKDSALGALRAGSVALVAIDVGAGTIDYRYDATRDESRTARLLFDDALQHALGRVEPLMAVDNLVTERGSRYIDFVIPGLLGMNLLGSGVWGLGFVLVDMRRKKLLKRLVATPMSRAQFLLSFLLSRLVLLVLEVAALTGFGVLAFDLPVTGPIWVLALLCVLGSLCFSGLGLLISSRARTVEGASGLMNAAMLPMWILSGVFFSSSHFPRAMQPLVHLLPLTAVNDALRANMLHGAGMAAVVPEVAVIIGWTVGCFALAFKLFRWK